MTLSGSFFFGIYTCISWCTRRGLTTELRLLLLKITLVLYLIPFPTFKYLFPEFLWGTGRKSAIGTYTYTENYVIYNQWEHIADIAVVLGWVWCIVSGVVAIIFTVGYMAKCFRAKKIVEQNSTNIESYEYLRRIEKVKREIGLKRHVRFVFSECFDFPFTVGFFSAIVVLPVFMKKCSDEEWDYMVRHELNHIKGWHMLIRLLALIVNLIHFFNPCAYLFRREIYDMCELDCDSKTIKNYDVGQRRRYGECIINLSIDSADPHVSGTVGLIGDKFRKKRLQRRILEMNRPKKSRKIVSAAAVLLAIFVGSTSVWAYEPANKIENNYMISPGADRVVYIDTAETEELDLNSGDIFTDKEGNVYDTTGVERTICFHSWVDVIYTEHFRNSDGGCTTYYYDAKRCSKCGDIKDTVYKNEMTYKICPHSY